MSTELIYQETRFGLKAELHCAMARIECTIAIYHTGYVKGKVTLHVNGTEALLNTFTVPNGGVEAAELVKTEQRNAIDRFLNQKWNPA